jgi:RNA polymerase sigma-70 factor (ECF subfamily)
MLESTIRRRSDHRPLVNRDEDQISDNELVARALVDRAEFAALYDRYATRIYRYCYRRLGNQVAAEDATSGTFIRAMEAMPSFRGGSFAGWLFAVAHSVVVNGTRRRAEAALDETCEVVDGEAGPEDHAVAAENRLEIAALLSTLPDAQRRVIELRLSGLTGAEIAESLDRTTAAVKMLQHRAMQRMRDQLGAQRKNKESNDD